LQVETVKNLKKKQRFVHIFEASKHFSIYNVDVINLSLSVCCPCPSIIATVTSNEEDRENATYSWPWGGGVGEAILDTFQYLMVLIFMH
jgi:hypothetical protein